MRIAIIGGIGSGKSAVVQIAKECGFHCISADEINSQLLSTPSYIAQIAQNFPTAVKDGNVDRAELASIVFSDSSKRELLNSIAHPQIMQRIKDCEFSPLAVELPLFLEWGDNDFDEVVLVKASLFKRIKRLEKRGLSYKEAISRIKAQVSPRALEKVATCTINNNANIQKLRRNAIKTLQNILSKHGV